MCREVVIKTLMVVHRLCSEGDAAFVKALSKKWRFNHAAYDDRRDYATSERSAYVRYYGGYMADKLLVFTQFGKCCERLDESEAMAQALGLSIDGFCRYAPLLLQQLEALVSVSPPRHLDLDTDVLLQYAYLLLLRDGYRLYSLINVVIMMISDNYDQMSAAQLRVCVDVCRSFNAHTHEQWQVRVLVPRRCAHFMMRALPLFFLCFVIMFCSPHTHTQCTHTRMRRRGWARCTRKGW